MLTKPTIEELLPKTENRYVLSMLTAKRARQLVYGGQPMVDTDTENVVSIAAEEINADQVKALQGKYDVVVPLRPEVEAERLQRQLEAEAKQRESRGEDRYREENGGVYGGEAGRQPSEAERLQKLMAEQLLSSVQDNLDASGLMANEAEED